LEIGCGRCEYGGTPKCKVQPWLKELHLLRKILHGSALTEEIKWSAPCYTHNNKNILTLSALKECVVVSFFKGAQMKDPEGILEKPGPNSRFARYLRFTDCPTIRSRQSTILAYVKEAIELEESGKKIEVSKKQDLDYPEELLQIFEDNAEFKTAFDDLTPGRQRGYLIHFTSAKQSITKTSRINKCMPKIFEGKGWNER
jgi:uncharacterized protein YdeI (YjbR/CyaY-like superfamily)